MIKCEWIDGTFIGCKDMDIGIHHSDHINFFTGTGNITIREDGYVSAAFIICPFCGADIRKPEPKQPTHEEIMTKWWKHWDGGWSKVFCYENDKTYGLLIRLEDPQENQSPVRSFVDKKYFTGRQSSDIPPEVLNG